MPGQLRYQASTRVSKRNCRPLTGWRDGMVICLALGVQRFLFQRTEQCIFFLIDLATRADTQAAENRQRWAPALQAMLQKKRQHDTGQQEPFFVHCQPKYQTGQGKRGGALTSSMRSTSHSRSRASMRRRIAFRPISLKRRMFSSVCRSISSLIGWGVERRIRSAWSLVVLFCPIDNISLSWFAPTG